MAGASARRFADVILGQNQGVTRAWNCTYNNSIFPRLGNGDIHQVTVSYSSYGLRDPRGDVSRAYIVGVTRAVDLYGGANGIKLKGLYVRDAGTTFGCGTGNIVGWAAYVIDADIPEADWTRQNHSGDYEHYLHRQYTCRVHTADETGEDLPGVTILCEDKDGNTVWELQTDAGGDLPLEGGEPQVVTHTAYANLGSDLVKSPHRFTLSKEGYETVVLENITVDRSIDWRLELKEAKEEEEGMDMTAILNSIRDALASSSGINAWCRRHYDKPPTIYKGADEREPPPEADYPVIHIFQAHKAAGYELDRIPHGIGATCGIVDAAITAADKEINDSLRNASCKWTASGQGTDEYYCESAGGGDPGLNQPDGIEEAGAAMTAGVPGSLAAGKWGWGDNDALGFNTVYARLSDGADPDGKPEDFIQTADTLTLKEYAGIDRIEAFRKLVETAVVGSVPAGLRVDRLDIDYETVEFFPFLFANMLFNVVEDYFGGSNPFS